MTERNGSEDESGDRAEERTDRDNNDRDNNDRDNNDRDNNDRDNNDRDNNDRDNNDRDKNDGVPTDLRAVARQAVRTLADLAGREVEGVSSVRRSGDDWAVHVEVLELKRIPDTTDVLASYEVTIDDNGQVTGYERIRRYIRGQTEEGP